MPPLRERGGVNKFLELSFSEGVHETRLSEVWSGIHVLVWLEGVDPGSTGHQNPFRAVWAGAGVRAERVENVLGRHGGSSC